MASAYPTALDDLIGNQSYSDGVTVLESVHFNNWQDAIDNLQEKVGVDDSAVTSSHDYRINRRGRQTVITTDATVSTGSTVIPLDDTKPQITEGDEYLSRAITPTDALNILEIEVQFYWATNSVNQSMIFALFQDATADAISAGIHKPNTANAVHTLFYRYRMVAGTTLSTTFRFRAGQATGGTVTMDGASGSRLLGGSMVSYMQITEWKV